MRLLQFTRPNNSHSDIRSADWSQQDVADFYRAHRLLVENGAAIGLDRGVSDIGEPWMVFFDLASQDVFLHIARIDNVCHLICEPFNMRIQSRSVTGLITEFENSVREFLSIRNERSKNVVIHPAARIIMSISAIFLLFKLENGEASARELSDKTGADLATGRGSDKGISPLMRAQTAFARAFEALDAPTNAAIMAGIIILGELALDQSKSNTDDVGEAVVLTPELPEFETTPVEFAHSEAPVHEAVWHRSAVVSHTDNSALEPQELRPELPNAAQTVHQEAVTFYLDDDDTVAVEADDSIATADFELSNAQVVVVAEKATNAPHAAVESFDSDAVKILFDLFGPLIEADNDVNAPVHNNQIGEISVSKLDELDDQVGFFMETSYSDSKLYSLMQYFAAHMVQVEFDYVSGKVLIEERNTELLAKEEVGLWTNVMDDGSTFSVIGKVGLIDDVVTFFA